MERNGNLYPTHGLGPISRYLSIYGKDSFSEIVSMSSLSSDGLERLGGPRKSITKQGDINISLIRTSLGKTIQLQYNVRSPRPYSRGNLVMGTKGIFSGYPDQLALEPNPHRFSAEAWIQMKQMYESKLWKFEGNLARKVGGHGGYDFMMLRSLIGNLIHKLPMDISVYESVLWSTIGPLSESSVSNGSSVIKIPDFTNGQWEAGGKILHDPEHWKRAAQF